MTKGRFAAGADTDAPIVDFRNRPKADLRKCRPKRVRTNRNVSKIDRVINSHQRTMTASTAVLLFMCVGTVFPYTEKMKFDPPAGRLRLAWRLAYWGGSMVFLLGAVLAADATFVSPVLKSNLVWVALFFVVVAFAGIVIQFF